MKKLLFTLVALVGCSTPHETAVSEAGPPSLKLGAAELTGYLGYRGELLLYETEADFRQGRYRHCTSGWIKGAEPDSGKLIYEGKKVRVVGEILEYSIGSDPISAMLATFKNYCGRSTVFRADYIEIIN